MLLLYVVLGMEIYISHDHFYYQLLFIVHDKIIMLIGTWRTTRENSVTTRMVWDALG
jgi:NADH:ubiquinone oxidoreductase subunit 3 (subunit A)